MINVSAVSFSGGASKSLNYFRVLKEIDKKGIKFHRYIGCSGGGIFAAISACGYSAEEARDILKEISGDKVMEYLCKFENEKNKIKKIWYGLIGISLKWIPNNSFEKVFEKYLKWEKVSNEAEAWIGVCDEEDVIRVLGEDAVNNIRKYGLEKFLNGGIDFLLNKVAVIDAIKYIPIYFISKSSIVKFVFNGSSYLNYEYGKNENKMSQVVMASGSNPLLSPVYLKIGSNIIKTFDGGLINNNATLPLSCCYGKCFAITCLEKFPEMGKGDFINRINAMTYTISNYRKNFISTICSSNVSYKGFFGFYNANIDEYYELPSSEIFKEKEEENINKEVFCDERR